MGIVQQQNVQDFTVAICKDKEGKIIVGTGCIVSHDGLIVTCAHVVRDVGVDPRVIDGESISILLPFLIDGTQKVQATVKQCVPEPYEDDVVLLKIALDGESLKLDSNHVAVLGRAGRSASHTFRSYGYRRLGEYQGLDAEGTIGEIVQITPKKFLHQPIRLDSKDIQGGMSGAAILDVSRNLVIGIAFRKWNSVGEKGFSFADRDAALSVAADVLALPPFNLPVRDAPLPVRPEAEIQRLTSLCNGADTQQIMQDRLRRYVGRKQELGEIRQRIEEMQPRGGYVLITGQAGQGKSSIIAKLVQQEEEKSQDDDPVIYHFVPYTPGTDHYITLIQNLLARLILKHDHIGLPGWYATDTSSPSNNFQSVLKELSEKGKYVVIFIDGVDQIEPDFRGQRELSFLPSSPPEGIVFVLSTRPDDTRTFLERHIAEDNRISKYPLPELNQTDFESMLEQKEIPLSDEHIQHIHTAMKGNALYLAQVVEVLIPKPDQRTVEQDPQNIYTNTVEQIIQKVEQDPQNIYTLTIERLKSPAEKWNDIIRPILGLLLVSAVPLSKQVLCSLTKSTDHDVSKQLVRMGGILLSNEQGYTLYHPKLRSYVRQIDEEGKNKENSNKEYLFSVREEQEFHQRLANWCMSGHKDCIDIWNDSKVALEHERRIYARHNYVFHLYKAGEWQQLFTVLDKGMYGKHKIRWDVSTHSYAIDLDLGRQAAACAGENVAEKKQRLSYLWRYSLLRCSLASRADRSPHELFEALVRVGREQEAIETAELLTKPIDRVTVLCKIADVLWSVQNDDKRVSQLLERAKDFVRVITDVKTQAQAWGEIAVMLVRTRQMDEALHTVQDIPVSQTRQNYFRTIVSELLQRAIDPSLVTLVAPFIHEIAPAIDKARVLQKTAVTLAQANDTKRAQEVLRHALSVVKTDHDVSAIDKARVLGDIAETLIHAGDRQGAHEVIGHIRSMVETTEEKLSRWSELTVVLSIVSIGFAQIGLIEKARSMVRKIVEMTEKILSERSELIDVLSIVSIGFAQIGLIEEARSMVQKINQCAIQAKTLVQITVVLGQVGSEQSEALLTEARSLVEKIESIHEQKAASQDIAKALIQARLFDDAYTVARNSGIDEFFWSTLREMAVALVQAGQSDKAFRTIQDIQYPTIQDDAWREVALKLAEIGQIEEAFRTIQDIQDSTIQDDAWREVALELAQNGLVKDAFGAMNNLNQDNIQEETWKEFALALARSGYVDEAKDIARKKIVAVDNQEAVLREIVIQLAQEGRVDEAQSVLWSIDFIKGEAVALSRIATVFAQYGKVDQACKTIQIIKDVEGLVKALYNIAIVLIQTDDVLATNIHRETLVQAKNRANSSSSMHVNVSCEVVLALIMLQESANFNNIVKELKVVEQKVIDVQRGTKKREFTNEQMQAITDKAKVIGDNPCDKVEVFDDHFMKELKQDIQNRMHVLREIVVILAKDGKFDHAFSVARSIEDTDNQAHALSDVATFLAQTGDHERLLRETQDAWKRATTRDEMIALLGMAIHLIPSYPPLGRALADGFTWVDNFLKGTPTVPMPIENNDPIAQGNI